MGYFELFSEMLRTNLLEMLLPVTWKCEYMSFLGTRKIHFNSTGLTLSPRLTLF